MILGPGGLHVIPDTEMTPQSQSASVEPLDLLELPSSVNGTYLAYPSRVPLAIAGTVASVSGSTAVAAVLLVASDELQLCRLSNQTGILSLAYVSNLKPIGEAFSQVTDLYMCPQGLCAAQPVLWVAMSQGRLAAVGFGTGKAQGSAEQISAVRCAKA